MKQFLFLSSIFILIICLLGFKNHDSSARKNNPGNILGSPQYTLVNINNMSMWVKSDGISAQNPNGDSGLSFPRGTGTTIYIDGIVWGGKVNDGQTPQLRVGGSTYRTGLSPGAILGIRTGNVEDPYDSNVKIWRIRADWKDLENDLEQLRQDAAEVYSVNESSVSQQQLQEVWDQYKYDWEHWPVAKGAVYTDIDMNGEYNHLVDIAGVTGADQTIWFVANDMEPMQTISFAGSQPIGLEMQMILWGYNRPEGDPFGDMIFKHVRLIYKGTAVTSSNASIEDMYLSVWADPDIGAYSDDFVGCDSVLELGYGYNGYPRDDIFGNYDLYPPAFGYLFMHGPIIPSAGDTAIYNFSKRPGFKNLKASSFLYFAAGGSDVDPPLGDYNGTLQWYNLMQGLRPQAGIPWINPLNNKSTTFPLGGDPVAAKGWIDGISYQAGDRRMGLTTGSFTMALGDTQEVVCALIGDISSSVSTAYIKNISGLKRKSRSIQNLIRNGVSLYVQGNSLSLLNETVSLSMFYLEFDAAESVVSSSWTLTEKPATSGSILSQTSGSSTSFIPDISGLYRITAAINTAKGAVHSAEFIVEAIDNKAAIGHISLDTTIISWGDSVLADGSASYDLDGDDLDFKWYAEGASISTDETGQKAYISPRVTGNHEVTLILFDGYFESITKQNFIVRPKIDSMTIKYSFIDTTWIRNVLYFHGDTLLVPLGHLDSLFIYDISDESISKTKSVYIPDKLQVFNLEDNLLYIGSDGESGYFGPGKLSIYEVGEDWALTPVLEDYAPDWYDISIMKFYDNGTLVKDIFSNLYRIDFKTDPSNPNVLAQANFSLTGVYNLNKVNNYIIMGTRVIYQERFILALDENTLSVMDTLDFPVNYRSFSIYEELLFLTFSDSTVIYNISDISAPERLSKITTISPVRWLIPGESGSYYHRNSKYVGNNLLAIHTTAGFQIYNINNPTSPSFVASYYCGMRGQGGGPTLRYVNGNYYATGKWDQVVYANDIYSGINRINFEIPLQINIPVLSFIPANYELFQNYPNPFNPSTTIEYYLPKKTDVSIIIYNVIGQKIATILDKKQNAAKHSIGWNGFDNFGHPVASGIYFYHLKTSEFEMTRKMLLIR
jgi:hypothetical protein